MQYLYNRILSHPIKSICKLDLRQNVLQSKGARKFSNTPIRRYQPTNEKDTAWQDTKDVLTLVGWTGIFGGVFYIYTKIWEHDGNMVWDKVIYGRTLRESNGRWPTEFEEKIVKKLKIREKQEGIPLVYADSTQYYTSAGTWGEPKEESTETILEDKPEDEEAPSGDLSHEDRLEKFYKDIEETFPSTTLEDGQQSR